eukprot:15883369-Heterocapsa_arctica.AAC.1
MEENKDSLLKVLNQRKAETVLQFHAPLEKKVKKKTTTYVHPILGNGDINEIVRRQIPNRDSDRASGTDERSDDRTCD